MIEVIRVYSGGKPLAEINLRAMSEKEDVLITIGATLRGNDSPPLHGRSLDAFQDVVGDWFHENAQASGVVLIRNAGSLATRNTALLMQVLDVFLDVEASAQTADRIRIVLEWERRR